MVNYVILINGVGGSGKDTFINILENIQNKYNIHNLSTISQVKLAANNFFGYEYSKTEKDRKFLSDLKKLWKDYNNGPVNYIIDEINTIINKTSNNIIFFTSRETLEIKEFKDIFTGPLYKNIIFKTLLIERNLNIDTNDSDKYVRDYEYDDVINNIGSIIDLQKKAVEYLYQLEKIC